MIFQTKKKKTVEPQNNWNNYVNKDGTLKNKINESNPKILAKKEEALLFIRLANINSFNFGYFLIDDYKRFHQYLFGDIYEFAGCYRTVNMKKHEKVLNGHSVKYSNIEDSDHDTIEIFNELHLYNKDDYKDDIQGQIWFLATHLADLWKVHPFREGNTRTTFSFMIAWGNSFLDVTLDPSRLYNTLDMSIRDTLVLANKNEPNMNPLLHVLNTMIL